MAKTILFVGLFSVLRVEIGGNILLLHSGRGDLTLCALIILDIVPEHKEKLVIWCSALRIANDKQLSHKLLGELDGHCVSLFHFNSFLKRRFSILTIFEKVLICPY